ncbi:hypothetical protein KSS87_020617, partial [Heliosperma pusillum]
MFTLEVTMQPKGNEGILIIHRKSYKCKHLVMKKGKMPSF